MRTLYIATAIVAGGACAATQAFAHGTAGARFFPATVLIEDPFVADELALPTYTHHEGGEEAGVTEDEFEAEFAKRITSNFALSIEGGWSRESGEEGDVDGFGNIGLGAKYQILKSEKDEFVLSAGVDVEFGGTGSKRLDVERFNTYTPEVFFGKGFGDLSKSVDLLRPFAVTGFAGIAIPGRGKTFVETIDPDTLDPVIEEEHHASHIVYGAAIEYSLPYLHANVRDVGLPDWLNQVTPLVEFSLSTPVDSHDGERTTGTINPGLIWAGQQIQLAAEAVIPINRDSGDNVGFTVQLHFYLDDIFPQSLGKPLIGD